MRAPLVPVTVAFAVGILLARQAGCEPRLLVVAGALGAAAALSASRRSLLGLLIVWCGAGALRAMAWEAHPSARLIDQLTDEPQAVRLHGIVRDDPVDGIGLDEAAGQIAVIEMLHQRTPDGWRPLAGRVRTTLADAAGRVAYGDEVLVEGQWSSVPAPGNPGQYDARAALARRHVHGLLRVRPHDGVAKLESGRGARWLTALFGVRHRWEQLIDEAFAPRDVGLLRSLLLGQRVALEERLREAFVETGTVHLLVISGFNVGLVAWLLELALRLGGVPWWLRLALIAAGLGGYCVLSGAQPPVVRATLMAWLVLGAMALDRVISWFNILAAAALAILWANPSQLGDPGFQLSFGAVLSLLLFAGGAGRRLEAAFSLLRPAWLRRYLALGLGTTAAVWVGLSAVLARYFGIVSPVSMLANLLLAPLVTLLVWIGTAVLALGTGFDAIVRWSGWLLEGLLEATVRCVLWCHAMPWGSWHVGQPGLPLLLGYYALLACSVRWRRRGLRPGRILLVWTAGLALWSWSAAARGVAQSRWLTVDVLDVGHGDSIVIRTPRGATLLVDAGSEEAGRFRVLPFLRRAGIRSLEALLLTHSDADHLGGAEVLLEELSVARLLTNGARGDTLSARRLQRLADEQGIAQAVAAAGARLSLDSGVTIEVLHPPPGLVPGVEADSNDNSVVLNVTKGSASILLTGDIEEAGLAWLMGWVVLRGVHVLKVPHHGSRLGAIGERFFEAARPCAAILSVGRAHQLPAEETVQALRRAGATLYSTREDGAVTIRTDGRRVEVKTFLVGTFRAMPEDCGS